jgi:hypothetical protein
MRQVTTRQFRACARRLREHPMTDKRRLAYLRRLLSRGVVRARLHFCPLPGYEARQPAAAYRVCLRRSRHITGLCQGLESAV